MANPFDPEPLLAEATARMTVRRAIELLTADTEPRANLSVLMAMDMARASDEADRLAAVKLLRQTFGIDPVEHPDGQAP